MLISLENWTYFSHSYQHVPASFVWMVTVGSLSSSFSFWCFLRQLALALSIAFYRKICYLFKNMLNSFTSNILTEVYLSSPELRISRSWKSCGLLVFANELILQNLEYLCTSHQIHSFQWLETQCQFRCLKPSFGYCWEAADALQKDHMVCVGVGVYVL